MKYIVTGAAGFIGFHVCQRLLSEGKRVVGIDGLTAYYDVQLKEARLRNLQKMPNFEFHRFMLEDRASLEDLISDLDDYVIVHLAAQAGVRYSLEEPGQYIQSNVVGTFNLLEAMRSNLPQHFMFASTSSVYGGNKTVPFSEHDGTDYPVSLYAATKRAAESMSHSYSHLFGIPTTCFRFFTVYGPWGRPDMALFKFVRKITNGEPIDVYGRGKMERDFTYIDDLVEAIYRLIGRVPKLGEVITLNPEIDSLSPVAPWRTVNIASGNPVGLMSFIEVVESQLRLPAIKNMLPMQSGDMQRTFASNELLQSLVGELEFTPIEVGVTRFVEWHREYERTRLQ